MDRLSPQDATFLYVENELNHMAIAVLGIFEGPAPARGKLRRSRCAPRARLRLAGKARDRGMAVATPQGAERSRPGMEPDPLALLLDIAWSYRSSNAKPGLKLLSAADFTYGAVMGLDMPFGTKGLAFSASARYMVTEVQPSDESQALDVDPVTILAELGYRF